jgi:hypothetical protein
MKKVRTVTWRTFCRRVKWVAQRMGRRVQNLIGEMR